MPTDRPLVSVSLVTYNHQKYIAEAIRSVLNQTVRDLEVIVVDDGSTDDTPRIIAAIDDPRIVSIRQPNGGPSAATNRALDAARGKYLALMTGDDVSHPDRLERQLAVYQRGPSRLLFSGCDFIDDDSRPMTGKHFLSGMFQNPPSSRAECVRRFFAWGNFINAVTGFTERSVIGSERYSPLMYQLQDYDMWVRLVKRFDIEFMLDATLSYRIRADDANLSSVSAGGTLRDRLEHCRVLRHIFDDMPEKLFREAFADCLRQPQCRHPKAVLCEQALAYFDLPFPSAGLIGAERLFELYNDPETAELMATVFKHTVPSEARRLTRVDPFQVIGERRALSGLYLDRGHGWEVPPVFLEGDQVRASFRQVFDIPAGPALRAVRWDPVEGRHCRIRLTGVRWQEANGRWHEVDPNQAVPGPAMHIKEGFWVFESRDPMMKLPVVGRAVRVEVSGEWYVESTTTTLARELELSEQSRLASEQAAEQQAAEFHRQLADWQREAERGRQAVEAQQTQLRTLERMVHDRDGRIAAMASTRGWRSLEKVRAIWRRLTRQVG